MDEWSLRQLCPYICIKNYFVGKCCRRCVSKHFYTTILLFQGSLVVFPYQKASRFLLWSHALWFTGMGRPCPRVSTTKVGLRMIKILSILEWCYRQTLVSTDITLFIISFNLDWSQVLDLVKQLHGAASYLVQLPTFRVSVYFWWNITIVFFKMSWIAYQNAGLANPYNYLKKRHEATSRWHGSMPLDFQCHTRGLPDSRWQYNASLYTGGMLREFQLRLVFLPVIVTREKEKYTHLKANSVQF